MLWASVIVSIIVNKHLCKDPFRILSVPLSSMSAAQRYFNA